MKYMISYFYQIRNFTPNMLPISTAMYPPKWFVKEGTKYWVDNNNVVNGASIDEFIFPKHLFNEEIDDVDKCSNECGFYPVSEDPYKWCPFMKIYYNYLHSQNLIDILTRYEHFVEHMFNKILNIGVDTIVFIVHEPPERYCGERPVLKRYFEENSIELEEFIYEK